MNLVKEHWQKSDITEFEKYLLSFSKGKEKGYFEKRIINTNLKCIAVPCSVVYKIVREIAKGNFIEFIDLWIWNNYTETSIIGKLICKIKDFEKFGNYLKIYANKSDNWATCDCLKFNINEENIEKFFNLACTLIKEDKPFVKRTGLNILFKMLNFGEYKYIDKEKYIDKILALLPSFKNEEHYYVNMMVAWLVAESFVKHREKTLNFLKTNALNKFTLNKAISKCHDSFRVSDIDKEMLKTFRQ